MGMERSGSGVIRLPPGFRFHPTDEELVSLYLKRKVFSYPVPAAIIPEIDFLRHNPADLPGGSEGERYFFNQREAKYHRGSRSNRATRSGSGYWKASGKDKPIIGSRNNLIIGFKKTLVFYQGKPPRGTRTDWIMHEYRLANDSMVNSTNWVLCRIFKKKRNSQADNDFMDNAVVERPGTPPPVSDSSCVTDTSDENAEEVSSKDLELKLRESDQTKVGLIAVSRSTSDPLIPEFLRQSGSRKCGVIKQIQSKKSTSCVI